MPIIKLQVIVGFILTDEPCTIENVPDISDVHAFLELLKGFGSKIQFKNNTVHIHTEKITSSEPNKELVKQMRASILLLGPLLARHGNIHMFFPGGCVLGKRSVHAHTHALEALGATIRETKNGLEAQTKGLKGAKVIMAEASVTATENALMAAVTAKGKTEIHWAAMEPHVQDLCHFLNAMGAKIEGIGSPTLIINGVPSLHGTSYRVTSDYLVTGTLALAALLTRGEVTLTDVQPDHLDSFWEKLEEVGARFKLEKDKVHLKPLPKGKLFKAIESLKTAVFPGFATDLQAPFTVLLTQAEGESRIFETLFEGRLNYLLELEKMGAKIKLHNEQQATLYGPSRLKGTMITSCDIRAGAGMVLAALVAEGQTEINDIRYIDRGYEKLDETLRGLGAKIERVE
ncbi:MAG: UDP-N-acetylglucosamine 1-carboxyvinyltransferase [Candidatus Peregrinibacteria bacterium GW2011_GWA2_44_7]|nr:MAG: UDP-N-acetylglucosamine 1-carboxyvinyltransferase [Candidatus Peregrinibacteria bacterium GW2011_GWA2_44_7]